MSKITITTRTPEQLAAGFAEAFKDIKPIPLHPPLTQADRLAPYRALIMKQRLRGLTWEQIAQGMRHPAVNEIVSGKLLQSVFGKPKKPAAAKAAPPPPDCVILDPQTGQPIPLPRSQSPAAPQLAPAPLTPKEHALFDPLLQGLIPPIVKVKMNRNDARAYANNAVEMMRPKEAERLHELLTAELDGLTEANCSRYNVPPEQIAPWKRKWA